MRTMNFKYNLEVTPLLIRLSPHDSVKERKIMKQVQRIYYTQKSFLILTRQGGLKRGYIPIVRF
jgi:hypothetical protein